MVHCWGVWPSFIALILLGFTGFCTVTEAFTTSIGNTTIVCIMFIFIMGAVVAQSGVQNLQ